uniref:Band 7 domain-containing protein n=1 Tax=Octactis speculum TaxID=3111310 RepID=A0A7S2BWP3_9STRA|mmetsp:Transcript_28351/g.38793  ORF Transcript_28351/g.38793 Transcript_28351/m.38793 type:complete len:516 (+) Transcript_28351:42-1589(+)
MGNIVVAPVNEAKIVSGCRGSHAIIGGCEFVFWWCETVQELPLHMLQIKVKTVDAETVQGVRVSIDGVICVRVAAWKNDGSPENNEMDRDADLEIDHMKVILAAQHFLDDDDGNPGNTEAGIIDTLTRVMEGHQRELLGSLTVDSIFKDREEFVKNMELISKPDLARMGLELVSYTVAKLKDREGYLDALGRTTLAKVKNEAEKGVSLNENEARKTIIEQESKSRMIIAENQQMLAVATSTAEAEAYVVVQQAKIEEFDAQRDVELKKANIDAEVAIAQAKARAAGVIEKESQEKEVVRKIAEQEQERTRIGISIEEEKAKKNALVEEGRLTIAEIEATRAFMVAEGTVQVAEQVAKSRKIEADGISSAKLLIAEHDALAAIAVAEGKAKAVEALGEAEAKATRLKGEAEAKALALSLEAKTSAVIRKYKEMGRAGVLSELFPYLPEFAGALAKPLNQTGEMVYISSDGSSATNVSSEICKMVAQVPVALENICGLDIKEEISLMQELRAAGDQG